MPILENNLAHRLKPFQNIGWNDLSLKASALHKGEAFKDRSSQSIFSKIGLRNLNY